MKLIPISLHHSTADDFREIDVWAANSLQTPLLRIIELPPENYTSVYDSLFSFQIN